MLAHQPAATSGDRRRACSARLEEGEQEALVRREEAARARHRDRRISTFGSLRQQPASTWSWSARICSGEEPSLPDHDAADEAAVAHRQERLGHRRRTGRPCRPGRRTQIDERDPALLEEPLRATAVERRARAARRRRSRAPSRSSPRRGRGPCSSRAHISGVSVSDTRPEARIATTIVTANSRKMRPTSRT